MKQSRGFVAPCLKISKLPRDLIERDKWKDLYFSLTL